MRVCSPGLGGDLLALGVCLPAIFRGQRGGSEEHCAIAEAWRLCCCKSGGSKRGVPAGPSWGKCTLLCSQLRSGRRRLLVCSFLAATGCLPENLWKGGPFCIAQKPQVDVSCLCNMRRAGRGEGVGGCSLFQVVVFLRAPADRLRGLFVGPTCRPT